MSFMSAAKSYRPAIVGPLQCQRPSPTSDEPGPTGGLISASDRAPSRAGPSPTGDQTPAVSAARVG